MQQLCIAWFFLLVCSFLHLLIMASAQQPTTQQTADVLLLFKQSITKDPSGALRSWVQPSVQESNTSSSPHFCSWFGITCNPQISSGFVIKIRLPGGKLEGTVTSSIGDIASLVHLDLSMNRFSGSVPRSLGMLSSLKTLNLSTNSFVGSIPTSLVNCSSLALLDISYNNLSGGITSQLGGLSSLGALLILPNNLLAGGLPSSIFNDSALQFLDLRNNRMTGQIPDALGSSRKLISLKLASNNLTGHIPGSFNATMSLQELDISNNMLAGEIPSHLTACASLAVVILSNNSLGGSVATRFGEMQYLRVLQLDKNNLSGSIPSSLGNCKRLENLILSHNWLRGAIPISGASLPNLLLSFNLSHNLLTGPIPFQLGGMSQVLKINMAHNMLSGNFANDLSKFLDLSSNHLTGFIPEQLGFLVNLKCMLNLSHNSLEGPIPDWNYSFQMLTDMNLSSNEIRYKRLNLNTSGAQIFFKKHMNSSWVQGNRRRARVQSLSSSCSLPACNTNLAWHAHIAWSLYTLLLLSIAVSVWLSICIFFWAKGRLGLTSSITTNDDFATMMLYRMIFSAEDIRRSINSVETSLIGSGASSDVYKVCLDGGQLFALKRFKPTTRQQLFDTELDVLSNLKHRNLVPMKGYWKEGRAILLEYMDNGSLRKQLYESPRCILDLEMRIRIATDTAEGLAYLHSYHGISIIHCDLKPGNILLDKHFTAYLADFGLATYNAVGGLTNARRQGESSSSSSLLRLQGTVGYIAPEYGLFKTSPSKAGDVYSYGVVLLELLTGRQPGHGKFPPGIYSLPGLVQDAKLNGMLESVLDPSLRAQMISRLDNEKVSLLASIGLECTNENHAARPSMEQVVSSLKHHPTFKEENPVQHIQ